MKLLRITTLILASGILATHAQDNNGDGKGIDVKPALMRASDDDRYLPAVEWKGEYGKEFWSSGGSFDGFFRATTEGTVAYDSSANSKNIFGQIDFGGSYLCEKAGWVTPFQGVDSENGGINTPIGAPGGPSPRVGTRRHYGDFRFSGTARFESDQTFDNYNFAYGPSFGYVHLNGDTKATAWWALVPAVQLGYHRVEVLQSRDFARLGAAEDTYWRFSGEADWTFKIGKWYDPNYEQWWGGLGLHSGIRYYKGYELPAAVDAANLDESVYYSGGVNYRFKSDSSIGRWISFTYLTVGHGRIPPQMENQTQVFVGIAVNFD